MVTVFRRLNRYTPVYCECIAQLSLVTEICKVTHLLFKCVQHKLTAMLSVSQLFPWAVLPNETVSGLSSSFRSLCCSINGLNEKSIGDSISNSGWRLKTDYSADGYLPTLTKGVDCNIKTHTTLKPFSTGIIHVAHRRKKQISAH